MSSSHKILNVVIIIIVLLLIYWYVWPYLTREGFVDGRNMVDNTMPVDYDELNKDIDLIQPPLYDAYTQTVQTGSLFIPQPEIIGTQGELEVLEPNKQGDLTEVGGLGDKTMNFNLCSPACCSDQWPVPFKTPVDKMTCESKDDFVPSNYFCNNGWQDSGCLCMKKDQSEFINTRGNNSDGLL